MKTKRLQNIIFSAMIAAIYASLTLVNPLSFGQVQLRVSELLTILAVITPAAIPGLTVGCLLANFASFMPLDCVFGTTATLLAAICAYMLRDVRTKGYPVLASMMPVIFNAIIIGAQLCLYSGAITLKSFIIFALSVGAGELAVCFVALLLFPIFEKALNKLLKK